MHCQDPRTLNALVVFSRFCVRMWPNHPMFYKKDNGLLSFNFLQNIFYLYVAIAGWSALQNHSAVAGRQLAQWIFDMTLSPDCQLSSLRAAWNSGNWIFLQGPQGPQGSGKQSNLLKVHCGCEAHLRPQIPKQIPSDYKRHSWHYWHSLMPVLPCLRPLWQFWQS